MLSHILVLLLCSVGSTLGTIIDLVTASNNPSATPPGGSTSSSPRRQTSSTPRRQTHRVPLSVSLFTYPRYRVGVGDCSGSPTSNIILSETTDAESDPFQWPMRFDDPPPPLTTTTTTITTTTPTVMVEELQVHDEAFQKVKVARQEKKRILVDVEHHLAVNRKILGSALVAEDKFKTTAQQQKKMNATVVPEGGESERREEEVATTPDEGQARSRMMKLRYGRIALLRKETEALRIKVEGLQNEIKFLDEDMSTFMLRPVMADRERELAEVTVVTLASAGKAESSPEPETKKCRFCCF